MSKGKSSERFGPFVLLRRLENDALGEVWRAVEWKPDSWGQIVVLHLLTGGDRPAVRQAAEAARPIVAALSGTTVARHQQIGVTGNTPWLAHEYPGGRSLQSIVTKARATGSTTPNPIPLDQVLAIVEKLALSVESLDNVRYQGSRVVYGSVLPQFVWVSEEGEIRAAGQQLGPGVLASLPQHADVRKDYAAYFAPELRRPEAQPSRTSDVWSLGAILYLLLTGDCLPDPSDTEAVTTALRAPRLLHRSEALPAEILAILRRALDPDPAKRYPAAGEMRGDLERLLNGGTYAPTTFNLAFYLSGLLRKEMEAESLEREREASLVPGDYAVTTPPTAPPPLPEPVTPVSHAPFAAAAAAASAPARSRTPLIAGGIALLLLLGAAATWFLMRPTADASPARTAALPPASQAPAAAATEPIAIEPIVAMGTSDPAASGDPDAVRQKALEDAINQRLQEEMMKLQTQYDRELQQQTRQTQEAIAAARVQSTPPPAAKAPTPAPARSEPVAEPPAATTTRVPEARPVTPATTTAPPVVAQPAPAQVTPQPAALQEGDLVAVSELDRVPEATAPIRPAYPPIALRRRTEGSVILSVLINESGRVDDIRVLRGDPSRLGFDEAAIRAVRSATFTPPMKDGKRVKTWKPVPVVFKP